MHAFINFIMGPMVWISFLIFFTGIAVRLFMLIRHVNRTEKFIYRYISVKYSFRSLLAWIIPFFPTSTRKSPVFYSVSYIFHLLLFLVPLFLFSHIIMFEESMNFSWLSLTDQVGDVLTIVVLFALLFFTIRRIFVPEVKFLTRVSDFVFISIVALPFLTGFLAYHQFFAYKMVMIAHVLSGELMIILIPFTRFFHMFLGPFSRAYTGSEFGKIRHAKDW